MSPETEELDPYFQTALQYWITEKGGNVLGSVYVLDPRHIVTGRNSQRIQCERREAFELRRY
ncbi:hypothetical protein YDYSY3_57530 [Paenibacillus chitinolyticus]|nr:hypothetical protein YDYSY3_57530 [Paenibacillus chitinolyticus]